MSMRSKHVLYLLTGAALLEGLFDMRAMTLHVQQPLLPLLSMLALSYLSFFWYRLDSDERGYRRNPWLNTGVVALGMVAIPYYLARSRPRGQKGRALLRLTGFALLQFAAAFVGAIAGALLFGLS